MAAFAVRLARSQDLPQLAAIETSAAQRFALSVLPSHLRSRTLPADTLAAAQQEGLVGVASPQTGAEPVGFLAAQALEPSSLHIIEMSVLPSHGGKGIGSLLLDWAKNQASARSLRAVTLTTFRDVAWNGPFYARRGFRVLAPEECSAFLRACLEEEAAMGLRGRIAMRHDLT